MEIKYHISAFKRQKHEKFKRNEKKPKEIKVYIKKEMQTEQSEREGKKVQVTEKICQVYK